MNKKPPPTSIVINVELPFNSNPNNFYDELYKNRITHGFMHKVDSTCRIGRTYADFNKYMEESPNAVVEMDSVIGRIGGKVLLTLMFKNCDCMLAFIRDRNTSQSVIDIFNWLYELLGVDCFKSLFSVTITDNRSEFLNPKALEYDAQGSRRTTLYYCDPYASFQKPNVELNHEFIRKILQEEHPLITCVRRILTL